MAYYSTRALKINGKLYGAGHRLPDTIQNVGALIERGDIRIVGEPTIAIAASSPAPTAPVTDSLPDSLAEESVAIATKRERGSGRRG